MLDSPKEIAVSKSSAGFFRPAKETARQGEQGFTLVEMLVVITIIGLIMGLIGPRVLNYLSELKVKAAKDPDAELCQRARFVQSLRGRYPSTSEGLAALVRRTPGVAAWNGPYLRGGNVPNDPWNNPVDRSCAGRARRLRHCLARLGRAGRRKRHGGRHLARYPDQRQK